MGHSGDKMLSELETRYCPPVDSALFAAVASDFDLTEPTAVNDLCQILDSIKESALEQEGLPFDPTGTFNNDIDDAGLGGQSDPAISPHTFPDDRDTTHSQTAVGTDRSLKSSGSSHEDTVDALVQMFPTISILDIKQSLKKSGGDPTKSMDVLLNLAFFDEAQVADDDTKITVPKGIDGFVEGNIDVGHNKGRKKKRNKNQKPRLEASSSSSDTAPNKWETGKADIEFMSSRIPDLSKEKLASMYHINGGSLFATIRSVALTNCPKDVHEIDDDPVMVMQLAELVGSFPGLQTTTLIGLLKATRNMPSAANDLAKILARRPSLSDVSSIIKFTSTPVNLSDDDGATASGSRSRSSEVAADEVDYGQASAAANASFSAGSAAYRQAHESYRRSKSNPLFAGATAVYRESAEEAFQRGRAQLSRASDHLVNSQSTKDSVDLHGVTVANAVRIARERVSNWWDGLGDAKYVRGGGKHVHGGYKIITGVGNHSQDGTSRLGPAVSKALIREGWKVEIHRGFLLVTGVSRAR